MKITHIAPYYFPHFGGVEKHVEEVAKYSARKGDEVVVVTLQDEKNQKQQEIKDGVKIFRIPTSTTHVSSSTNSKLSFSKKLKYKISVWQWVWQHKHIFIDSDIVHVHDVFWWILPIWPFIRKKVFITFHGWEGIYPVPFKNKLQRLIWSKLSRGSIHVGDYISEFYYDRPDIVVYGGVTSPLASSSRRFGGDSDSSPSPSSGEGYKEKISLVFVGRLEKVNDIEVYINLVKDLKKELAVRMLWCGDGSFKNQCQKLGKVLGCQRDQEKIIKKADLIFASSYLSILKAQALGKMVVAIYSNKLKQSYLENYPGSKYMLIASSEQSAASSLIKLLKNKVKLFELQQAAKKFATKMTWESLAKNYENLYSDYYSK